MVDDRRTKTRVPFKTQVVIRTEDTQVTSTARSKDVSLRGLYITTGHPLPVGTPCEVEIHLTGSSSELFIRVKGRVARMEDQGLGIEFESIDPDSHFHLRNLIMYNTSDPDAIEREGNLR